MGKSSGGGGGTQTTEPWGPQMPYLQSGFQRADQLYRTGGPRAFQGQTFVDLSGQTNDALQMMESRARSGSPLNAAASNHLQGALGTSVDTSGAMNSLNAIAQNGGGIGQGLGGPGRVSVRGGPIMLNTNVNGAGMVRQRGGPAFVNTNGGSAGQVQAHGMEGESRNALTHMAQGGHVGQNPNLDAQFDRAANRVTERFNESVMPGINLSFSAAGGGGSSGNQMAVGQAAGEVADSLGDMGAEIYGNAYENDRNRQLSAASTLGQQALTAGQQGLTARMANQAEEQQRRSLGSNLALANQSEAQNYRALGANLDLANQSEQQQRRALIANMGMANQAEGRSYRGDQLRAQESNQNAMLGARGQNLSAQQANANARMGAAGQILGRGNTLGAQQLQAAQMAPMIAGQDYSDIDRLMGVGGVIEGQAGRILQDRRNRFDFNENRQRRALQDYIAGINGNFGATTRSEEDADPLGGLLGGAIAGGRTFGPFGAIGGGILGALRG